VDAAVRECIRRYTLVYLVAAVNQLLRFADSGRLIGRLGGNEFALDPSQSRLSVVDSLPNVINAVDQLRQ